MHNPANENPLPKATIGCPVPLQMVQLATRMYFAIRTPNGRRSAGDRASFEARSVGGCAMSVRAYGIG